MSDEKSEIIGAFGIRNERFQPGSYGYGMAHPALFVIDPSGIVKARHSGPNYRQRPEPEAVLNSLN